jgi:RNA polymerase sigma-70 factor, ECF subfamily
VVHQFVQTFPVLNDAPTPPAADSEAIIAGPRNPAPSETARLTRAIVAGDESAFSQFYDLYAGRLCRFLLVLTSGQEDLARELHQVVMIKVARKCRVFTADEELWAWLAQVARHAFIDCLRQQNRRSELPFSESALDALHAPERPTDQVLIEWLDHGLESLEAGERALVQSVYFQERTHGEVAAESGQTAKAVESRLARIRARLRQFMLKKLRHETRET